MSSAMDLTRRLAEVLKKVGVEAQLEEHFVLLPTWGLRLIVMDWQVQETPGRALVQCSVMAYSPRLPSGFARELLVGMGTTTEKAIGQATANWMLLFFSALKFVFDDQAHDCTVNLTGIQIPNACQQDYRLIEGPVQMMGFGETHPEGMSQSRLWDCFSDLLLPKVTAGIKHIRCYACKTADWLDADVFVNGEKWAEGSGRLLNLAQSFPTPDQANPIYSLKQHLFLCPGNLGASLAQEKDVFVAEWAKVVAGKSEQGETPLLPHVLHGLFALGRHVGQSEAESEAILVQQGMPSDIAVKVVTFLPSAATWALMAGKVKFAESYLWTNSLTRQCVQKRYDQTPLFVAALHTFSAMCNLPNPPVELWEVANTSAEMNAISQAARSGAKLEEARFTEMIVFTSEPIEGQDIDLLVKKPPVKSVSPRSSGPGKPLATVTKPPAKPASQPAKKAWWKFW